NECLDDYYGRYCENPEDFSFLPGHINLIEEIIKYIQAKTELHGPDFFTIKTTFDRKKQPLRGHSKGISSPSFSTTEALPATSLTFSTNLPNNCEDPNVEDSRLDSNVGNSEDSRGVSHCESYESTVKCPEFTQLQQNIFTKALTWTKKNHRGVYEQYSHRFNINMVVLNKNDEQQNGNDLNVYICCPICRQPEAINKKVKDDEPPSLTISNYQRHVKRHIEKYKVKARERKAKPKARSSQKIQRYNTLVDTDVNQKRIVRRRSKRNNIEELVEESLSSSDSDDNAELYKEMHQNFESGMSDFNLDISSDENQDEIFTVRSPNVRKAHKITTKDISRMEVDLETMNNLSPNLLKVPEVDSIPTEVTSSQIVKSQVDVNKVHGYEGQNKNILGAINPNMINSGRITRSSNKRAI
ncbi:hypothetical protein Bhyg_01905, partial [Pseudolycoriella hygida]